MSSWRDQILREFTPNVARLTLVADPDGLLLEERILDGISQQGFDVTTFEDRVAFRYAYESAYRDRSDQKDLVVVLHSQASDLILLPYDLLDIGRRLSFSLGDIFPKLSYPVVASLDRGDLDALYDAQKRHAPGQLGENATKEFVLRHVFEIAPELIKQQSDLLRVLLRRHYQGQLIPSDLDKWFIQLLQQNKVFNDWPLDTIVSDREAFFTFLQERWPIFLDREIFERTHIAQNDDKSYDLTIKGPADLPFDHNDIRVYIDNLFVEGLLRPITHEHAGTLSGTWMGIGVHTDPGVDRTRRLGKLIDSMETSIPADNAKHTEWLHFARRWAQMVLAANNEAEGISEPTYERVNKLQAQVDNAFTSWLLKRYAGLINLPPVPPVMLHHLPRFLARQMEDNSNSKIAMIVVDGLALDQWLIVREKLASKLHDIQFREQAVFAWVPSITSVSRQAAFAGKAPIFFPGSIHTTDKEEALWSQFWVDNGLKPNEIVYMKGLGEGSIETVSEILSHPKVRVAGLVLDKVDKIMHGMEMGTAGMHNQVGQWAGKPYLSALLDLLLDRGFQVFLTSDHGNIEAEGCGSPSEGAIADMKGQRVRIYSDVSLRSIIKELFSTSLEWNTIGLPENYLALLAPARHAFIQKKKRIVCHGGISIEELIVPFIQIERTK